MAKIKTKKTQSQSSKKKKLIQKQKQKQNININIDLSKKGGTSSSSRKASSQQPQVYFPPTPMYNTFQTPNLDNMNNMVTKDDLSKQIQSALVDQDKARREFAADQNRNQMRELMMYQQGLYPGGVMFPMTATREQPTVRATPTQPRPLQPIPLVEPSSRLVVPPPQSRQPPPPPRPPSQPTGQRLGGEAKQSRLVQPQQESKPELKASPPILPPPPKTPPQIPYSLIPPIPAILKKPSEIAEPKPTVLEKLKSYIPGLKPQPTYEEKRGRTTPEDVKKFAKGTFGDSPLGKNLLDSTLEKMRLRDEYGGSMQKEFEMKKIPIITTAQKLEEERIKKVLEADEKAQQKYNIVINPLNETKTPDIINTKNISPISPPKSFESPEQLFPVKMIPVGAPYVNPVSGVKWTFTKQIEQELKKSPGKEELVTSPFQSPEREPLIPKTPKSTPKTIAQKISEISPSMFIQKTTPQITPQQTTLPKTPSQTTPQTTPQEKKSSPSYFSFIGKSPPSITPQTEKKPQETKSETKKSPSTITQYFQKKMTPVQIPLSQEEEPLLVSEKKFSPPKGESPRVLELTPISVQEKMQSSLNFPTVKNTFKQMISGSKKPELEPKPSTPPQAKDVVGFPPGVSGKGIFQRSPEGQFVLSPGAEEKIKSLKSSPQTINAADIILGNERANELQMQMKRFAERITQEEYKKIQESKQQPQQPQQQQPQTKASKKKSKKKKP